jgi:HSP20 family molecular chaperone IbpA
MLDVWETENELVYAFDLPGIPRNKISIDLHDDTLTVSGSESSPASGRRAASTASSGAMAASAVLPGCRRVWRRNP